jgi:hypothetical protein
MALRLERVFGADRQQLLDLQAASERDRAVPVSSYVPDFLDTPIRAKHIERWAAAIDARKHLPVLLRRVIHSTGRGLHHVDFPGFDNAQRRGWDGWVEADEATPWVPEGRSGWECSVEQNPKRKAESDYQARLSLLTPAERADCTFVFVTLRNWKGKAEWAKRKIASCDWKDVRAFDASDLEQWLETAVAPQIWLARELELPTTGFRTIDECWDQWAACEPPMTDAIFAPSIERHSGAFCRWLTASPDCLLTVAADSREEAVAFIACLLRQDDLPAGFCDRAVLFDSAATLRLLTSITSPFIPIVCNEETERAIGDLYRRHHCIVVRPRNAVDRRPDIEVDLLSPNAFATALTDMGIERNDIAPLARASGLSPTVLRRQLSKVPAVRTPLWAQDTTMVRHLIPMALVGTWHAGSKADRQILAALADTSYRGIEDAMADLLLQHDDCPVWQIDQHCGVTSKIDALFAVAPLMTRSHIIDFVDFAEYVLSEADPGLELPRGKRWMAGLYGKVREHSAALRTGVCETLVLLAIHGNSLFRRLGHNIEAQVSALVRRLLTPLTGTLLSHEHDLPNYAEAAPEAFLTLLEEDLRQPDPALRKLLEPAGPAPFDTPSRTGLLWALERLAWNSEHLMRVVLVLADLSHTEINDRWSNTPIDSLFSIFRSWIPQTAAPLDQRIQALEKLCERFPDVGWQICVRQLEFDDYRVAHYSNRPRWRNDASEAGEQVTREDEHAFIRRVLDLTIKRKQHNAASLGDLIEHIGGVPEKDRVPIWNLIDRWLQTNPGKWEKAKLRDRIRDDILSKGGGLGREIRRRGTIERPARAAYEKLAPCDPVARNAWLFSDFWVCPPPDEGQDPDRMEQGERAHVLRTEAMSEIWSAYGLGGVIALLSESDGLVVGRYAAPCAADKISATNVLVGCLAIDDVTEEKVDDFLLGFIESVEDDVRTHILSSAVEIGNGNEARIFRCAPFNDQTWRLLDKQVEKVRDQYWRSVSPRESEWTEHEIIELLDRLLQSDRPRAAFYAVKSNWGKVASSSLKRLLDAVASVNSEPADHFKIDRYYLSKAFQSIGKRPGTTSDEMAQLEFRFIEALQYSEHGIPHLEQRIMETPRLFVEVVALAYGGDGAHDPSDDPGRHTALVGASKELLVQIKRIPGTNSDGQVDTDMLMRWVAEARALCKDHSLTAIGDVKIGELLARAPHEDDTRWPCRPVCEVLETIDSRNMAKGLKIGVYNSRGATMRGVYDGGSQERDLAAGYAAKAQAWRYEYPFVAKILKEIAESYELDAKREDTTAQVRKRQEL